MAEPEALTAAELGRRIEAGQADPVDLAEEALARAEAHAHVARIFARLTPERARAEAAAARARSRAGLRRSPLDGVPVSWKDLFDTAGIATEAGSALLAGRVPERDARVLASATSAGLVCLGKTHMTELAFSGLGINPMTGTSPNALAADLAPGGSSSGAAVSVALGLAAAAVGSDTGGSVRIPAAWNGLVGLKTTSGLLPLEGVVPLCPSFDTVGPITRSVEDAGLMLAALGGGRAPDLRGASLAGMRFLALEATSLEPVREAPQAGYDAALARIAAAGATIVPRRLAIVDEAMPLSATVFAAEAYGIWRDRIEAAPHLMFAPVRERFRGGASVSAPDFVAAWQTLNRLRAAWLEAVAGFDAVLLPTCPILPPDAARLLADDAFFAAENLLTLRNTRVANLFGLPALTLPTAVPHTGIMLMTPPMTEAWLLRIGAAAEAALA